MDAMAERGEEFNFGDRPAGSGEPHGSRLLDSRKVPTMRVYPIERAQMAIDQFDAELIQAWTEQAERLMGQGDAASAQTLLRYSLNKDPYNEAAICLMAECLYSTGHQEESVKLRRALVKINRSFQNLFGLANALYGREEDALAREIYQELLTKTTVPEEHTFELYKNLGNIYVRSGDFDLAEDCYNRAFVVEPKSDAVYVNYGTLEINRDQLDAAKERFVSAIEINARNDQAWVGLALVHRAKGDFELSWANLERAIDINGKNRTALKLIVEWGVRDGRIQIAAERVGNYLAHDGEDATMAFLYAKCLTLLGCLSEALLECERVVALDPECREAFQLRQVLAQKIIDDEVSFPETTPEEVKPE